MLDYPKLYNAIASLYGRLPRLFAGGRAFPPLHLFVEVTYRCNLSCQMCQFFKFMHDGEKRPTSAGELSADEVKSVLGELPWYALATFTGGELFVRKDMMEILEWAAAHRRISIITNGTLMDDARAEKLAGMAPSGIFGRGLLLVDFSLEGIEDTHDSITGVKGSYAKTLDGITRIVAARKRRGSAYPLVNIKTVVSRSNVGELAGLFRMAGEIGVDIFNPMIYSEIDAHSQRLKGERSALITTPPPPTEELDAKLLGAQLEEIQELSSGSKGPQLRFTPPGMSIAEVARYYEHRLDVNDYSCYSPWTVVNISAYGEVSVCPYSSQGNIRDGGLRKAWNGEAMRGLRRQIRRDGIYPGCMGCCNMSYVGRKR